MSIDSKVEGVRALSVAGAATVGSTTTTDLIQYGTLLFIAFQLVVITPKVLESVKGLYNKLKGVGE